MITGKEIDFSLNDDDFKVFQNNGVEFIYAFKEGITKYENKTFSEFYSYLFPYLKTISDLFCKYDVLEYISGLDDFQKQRFECMIEKESCIYNAISNLEGVEEFMSTLILESKEDIKAYTKLYKHIFGSDEQSFLREEIAIQENIYYENIENYFENIRTDVIDQLNNVLSIEEKQKFFYAEKENGEYFPRSYSSLFDDIFLHSKNKKARLIAKDVYQEVCSSIEPYSNQESLDIIISGRKELAKMNGCENYFEYTKNERTLKEKEDVEKFLDGVLHHAKSIAVDELEILRIFVKNHYNVDNLGIEDLGYYVYQYQKQKYKEIGFDLKNYFTTDKIVDMGISLVEETYNLHFEEIDSIYKDDKIKVYKIYRDGVFSTYGVFDLYERENKQISGFVSNLKKNVNNDYGVLYLSCSFTKELNFIEIENYLHELGHCVHDTLFTSDYLSEDESDINRDLIEIPSRFFENFLFEPRFYNPEGNEEVDKIFKEAFKIYKFFFAYDVCKQIAFSFYDIYIHSSSDFTSLDELNLEFENIVNKCIPAGLLITENVIYSFEHIFSNSYECSYYGYVFASCYSSYYYELYKKDNRFLEVFKERFLKPHDNEILSQFISESDDSKDDIYNIIFKYYNDE